MPELDLKKILEKSDAGADWLALREVSESSTTRVFRDELPEGNSRDFSHGIMASALVGGSFGYSATCQQDEKSILNALKKAELNARRAAEYPIFNFDTSVRPRVRGHYSTEYKKALDSITGGECAEFLVKACRKLKVSDKIVTARALITLLESRTHFVSTNGSDYVQEFKIVMENLAATAQDGSISQTRTDGGYRGRSYQGGMELVDEARLLEQAETIGSQALELLSAEECSSEICSLLLAPDQMMLQIHESIGHPLEIDRILGDERNYAGSSFVKVEDFGSFQYGSDLMNITFDPEIKEELASYAFDDGGAPARKEYLIKDGMLLKGLGGLESQARSGVPGVACFRASSWNRAPIDRIANVNLEPGASSRDEIISSVERGVYMETNRSWSIDDLRNKFQFGCEYAKLIEDGELTRTLRNPNYRGISSNFWRKLAMVGNPETSELYSTPYCGKGEPNQVIRVGHAAPLCLFSDIEVFGGA